MDVGNATGESYPCSCIQKINSVLIILLTMEWRSINSLYKEQENDPYKMEQVRKHEPTATSFEIVGKYVKVATAEVSNVELGLS